MGGAWRLCLLMLGLLGCETKEAGSTNSPEACGGCDEHAECGPATDYECVCESGFVLDGERCIPEGSSGGTGGEPVGGSGGSDVPAGGSGGSDVPVGDAGIEWIRIEGGRFQMGSPDGVTFDDECPQRWVMVGDFELSKSEVTTSQYQACVNAGACMTLDHPDFHCNWGVLGREDHPINCVDWNQAKAFARWVGGRLPTEAEWEYAARSGGRDQSYPWGDDEPTCSLAVIDDGGTGCGLDSTWPVCSKPLGNSAQGLCDLAGNVWEWVEDEYCEYSEAPTDGTAASCGSRDRVNRGGSWFFNKAVGVRVADRYRDSPGVQYASLGFRVAR